jgi:hypothetical protein
MSFREVPNLALILKAYRTGGRSNETVVVRKDDGRAGSLRACTQ